MHLFCLFTRKSWPFSNISCYPPVCSLFTPCGFALCVYTCICIRVCLHVHTCMWRMKVDVRCLPSVFALYADTEPLHCTWSSAANSRDRPVYLSLRPGTRAFYENASDLSSGLTLLCSKHIAGRHLPSPLCEPPPQSPVLIPFSHWFLKH